jgi:RimJ/RimL family protein N-acetyltransferase
MKKFPSYETERLILKPFDKGDAAFLIELLNSPKWLKYIGQRNVHTIPEAENYIEERMTSQLNRLGYGNNLVIRKDAMLPMGACGLYERPGLDVVDIGFAFLEPYEGKGYGMEAASKLLQVAKEDFNLTKVCAITDKENLPSQKLLSKLGLLHLKNIEMEGEELMYYEVDI